ncbi:EH domain binding protein epsin 2 [Paracoccidioides lutzii Pb01]|uniref:EH domain binding protein epsin 2 n=1 Tax=Paracoccidioides lutzii (strain ATCC MYA-826 / Pb01) TaxID=502779 RepID=C1H2L1_PARBA|nr:EH domain binding protein epsin 2 [Paracoccidioides lutzii Pb01]EEH33955.1 EH domain binding protein epsin 2 [Paracoccidioides lutzii Pb01]
MSKVVRSVKNVTKGYSSVQVKVRNATSNDPWGPTGTEMGEIAAMTFHSPSDFYEIMDMLDKRLNDKGKNWRHVLKSLKVLDYCLHEGSEMVVTWARKNIYIIKTLREFQYIDDDGRDVGQNVRVSAKELTALILDEERLRNERSDRKLWKSRVTGIDDGIHGIAGGSDPGRRSGRDPPPRPPSDEEDAEYRLAIEASKHEAEEERKRRQRELNADDEDDDLAKAIKLSKEEEELRRRELEESNASALFDDNTVTPAQPPQPQVTGYNQGYQQQPAVDWFGNPVDQQQSMSTGYLNNQYTQPTGFQPQQTGYTNGYTGGFPAQQPGYDQFQQQNNFMQPQTALQPQQTAFNNPYGDIFGQPQQPQQQDNNFLQAGSHNPWASNQQQSTDALKPMPTGSNNPFASSFTQNQAQRAQKTGPPSLGTLAQQRTAQPVTNHTQFSTNPITNFQPPSNLQQQQLQQQQQTQNPQHARLNALLATGDGQDTFGNVGDLRIPAQHTTPGVFVNSAGQGLERLQPNQTANNPFLSQQFTGAQQQRTNNPFGMQQSGYAASQQRQSGNLIDI